MKKLVISLLLSILFCLAVPTFVSQAADVNTISMEEEGSQAKVTLSLPNTVGDEITSLRLQFLIHPEEQTLEEIHGEFIFADSLPGLMKEYRYQKESGMLTIYVTGRTGLLNQTSGEALLGYVSVTDNSQNPVKAEISVQENGLEIVNRVNQMQNPVLDNAPSIVIGGEEGTDSSEESSQPDETQESQEESSGDQTTSPEESSAQESTEDSQESSAIETTEESQESSGGDSESSAVSPTEGSSDIEGGNTNPSTPDSSKESSTAGENGEEDSTSTGDSSHALVWMIVAVASLGVIVIIALVYVILKSKNKK